MKLFWRAANWVRGLGFYWADGALEAKPGACPYPIHPDWSVRRCVRMGACGCERGQS
jgi:hypothetical protein